MSHYLSGEPKLLLARELVGLNDRQLDEYLEENHQIVQLEDPHNLPESFIQRLRDRGHQRPKTTTLDLGEVNARLLGSLQVPTPPKTWEDSCTQTTASPAAIDELERNAYHTLIFCGGRPAYPVCLVAAVCADAFAFRQLVSPWILDEWDWQYRPEVFENQTKSWREFRAWQYCVRKRPPVDGAAHMSTSCEFAVKRFDRARTDKSLAGYAESAKLGVLDRYNIDIPFKPAEDPLQQNALTTWLEYVVCKHWLSKTCADEIALYEDRYQTAWVWLTQSGVLLPSEEEPSQLIDNMHTWRRKAETAANEIINARLALQRIRETWSKEDDHSSATMKSICCRVDEAKRTLQRIRKRTKHVGEWLKEKNTWQCNATRWRRAARRHAAELPWVVQQVTEVQAESSGRRRTSCETTAAPLRRSPRLAKRQNRSSPNEESYAQGGPVHKKRRKA